MDGALSSVGITAAVPNDMYLTDTVGQFYPPFRFRGNGALVCITALDGIRRYHRQKNARGFGQDAGGMGKSMHDHLVY